MLNDLFTQEKSQLPCWTPVLIAIGILLRFNLESIHYGPFLSILTILAASSYFCRLESLRIILLSASLILTGIFALEIRIRMVDSPIIPFNDKFTVIKGKIDNITPLDHGYRVLLSDIKIKKLKALETPKRIRLTVRTKLNDAKIGNIILVNAILNKPMAPYLPDSYNFARDAYFKKIGAVGYSVSEFKVINYDKKSFLSKINTLRNNIQNRVNTEIGSYQGSIVTALMLNEYSNIDKKLLRELRATGLAHILSVSGMHLSLVAAIFFFSSRFLLNCFPTIALRVNSKKIAAFISLLGSFAYLLISGMEVAAVRSFIMTSMIIIAIIIDRISTPMRAIAAAATIILLLSPENIVHPSFQMSFAAVIALIACFEFFKKLQFDFTEFNLVQKFLFYLLSLSFASLVAGLATTPFALYHFSQSSNYSILANLLAVPITSFWLMPGVVLTFLLYPLHLEILSLYPMKWGISLMIEIAHYIANLPYSVSSFAKITDSNLLIIVSGMLWFCIWKTIIRFLGIAIIMLGILLQSLTAKPDIFIDWDKKNIAILTIDNRLVFLTKPLPKFKKQLLMNYLGSPDSNRYNKKINYKGLNCVDNVCTLYKNNYDIKFYLNDMVIEVIKENILKYRYNKSTGIDFIYLDQR